MQSLIISALRMVVIVLPIAAVFARLNEAEKLVWTAFPIAEIVSFFAAIILTLKLYGKTKNQIQK